MPLTFDAHQQRNSTASWVGFWNLISRLMGSYNELTRPMHGRYVRVVGGGGWWLVGGWLVGACMG